MAAVPYPDPLLASRAFEPLQIVITRRIARVPPREPGANQRLRCGIIVDKNLTDVTPIGCLASQAYFYFTLEQQFARITRRFAAKRLRRPMLIRDFGSVDAVEAYLQKMTIARGHASGVAIVHADHTPLNPFVGARRERDDPCREKETESAHIGAARALDRPQLRFLQ